jgi:diguanylate cyclase (GGDEF)-like protein
MKTVAEFMATAVVTAAPGETVTAVARRLTKHRISGLPVTDGGAIVGIVTLKDLVGQPPYRPVREVMTREIVTVAPTERITEAYAMMDNRRIGRLPVVDQDALVGIVTRRDLLKELGRLTDAMTDLPWSETLRQEAEERLKAGREISVLFLDLDDFGIVNKLYGHVVGDRVIKAVAAFLRASTDPELDVICRYAGDEFAMVTVRTGDGAMALARRLREGIVTMDVPGAPPGAISGSIGVAGGKRSSERHDIHYDATVDDLITMASRASTLAKRTELRILHSAQTHASPSSEPDGDRRVAIRRIDLGIEDGRGVATVELERDGRRVTGRARGSVLGTGGMRLLVEATVTAARHWLPPQWDVSVEEITRTPLDQSEAVHILLVMGSPASAERHVGSALYTADPHEAVVKATMKAVNHALVQPLHARG